MGNFPKNLWIEFLGFCCFGVVFPTTEAAFNDVFSTFEDFLERLWLFPVPWYLGKNTKVVLNPFKCLDSIWSVWMTGIKIQKPPGNRGIHLNRMQVLSVFLPVCRCCSCRKGSQHRYFFHVNFQSLLFFIKYLTVKSTLTFAFQVRSLRRKGIVLKKLCFACLFHWISSFCLK